MTKSLASGAAEFLDSQAVAAYVHRPDYPAALYDALLALTPRPGRVLDIGTGPGKIARPLAGRVNAVLAVDPSVAMLDLARSLDGGKHANIAWTHGAAEDLSLGDQSLDLAVAGASIHWIDCSRLCPKLDRALSPRGVLAIVDGDVPSAAPWLETYLAVIRDWVERLGGVWRGAAHSALISAHVDWLELEGTKAFSGPVHQTVDDLIACQHSRATFSPARMGHLAEAFDSDLRVALEPWTVDGLLSFEVETRLTWGRPRSSQAEPATHLARNLP